MQKIKEILIRNYTFVIVLILLIMPVLSFAEGLVPCGKAGQPECNFNTFMDLINNVIKFILVKLAVPIAAVMFFYAGFKMVTSGGSAESKTQAKSIFTNTALGVAFVAGAWLIIRTVLFILGYEGAWIGF
jgi:hypothetical protein